MQVRGSGYEGLTTPQLRSFSTRNGRVDDVDSDAESSSTEELEALVNVRLPEQPPSIMLKEVLPLPPIEL